jgi:glycosyltransferase involved in cell wall biosynthesis
MLGNLSSSKVTIVGQVEDVKPWLEKASVVISPIRSGGGARTKNLEALALGRPLVTTTLGSEGLRELPGHSYLAADKPEAFASLVIQLLQDKNFRDHIGKAGRNMVERFHAAKTIGAELEQILLAVSKSERTIDKI